MYSYFESWSFICLLLFIKKHLKFILKRSLEIKYVTFYVDNLKEKNYDMDIVKSFLWRPSGSSKHNSVVLEQESK